jgi:hypothetical protein
MGYYIWRGSTRVEATGAGCWALLAGPGAMPTIAGFPWDWITGTVGWDSF